MILARWRVSICVTNCISRCRPRSRKGATLLLGGEKISGEGNYYAPTVLSHVTPTMTAFRQELFGPVAAITVAKDAEHALQLANDSDFGLSATVFTANEALAGKFARELECGGVFINGFSASDARVAFGGVKKSGFGRELSHFGLHEFCNVQTVWKEQSVTAILTEALTTRASVISLQWFCHFRFVDSHASNVLLLKKL